jgi:hypothetical protein
MALIRVYIQPRFPSATDQTAFYDFSGHLEFDSLNWEQNDQGVSSSLQVNHFAILPASTTQWSSYAGATEADKITNALSDPFFHLRIYPRTEIQIRDISTSPHTILWGGIITRVQESRDGGAITGSLEAVDYTALLDESVALEYTALGQSTIKQVITSQTYSFTASLAERTAGEAAITIGSIAIGDPYNRNLQPGDTVVIDLSDDTYDGVSTITSVEPSGASYKIKFTQYSNVADSASRSVTGFVTAPGFVTTNNAPGLDSRIRVQSANISDLNPSYKVSPRNQNITRAVSAVSATTTLVTITTSATHGFSKGSKVTVTITNGPTGVGDASLNGIYTIKDTPTNSSFTYDRSGSALTSGSATGTAVAEGDMVPMPFKGGTLADNLSKLVKSGTGTFYLNAGTIESGALKIDLFAKPMNQIDAIAATGADPLFATATGWTLGSFTRDTVGNTGPYGVGNTVYYTGLDKQTAELSSAYRVPVSAGENYFVSWRAKATQPSKAHPSIKFYNSGGTVVGNPNGYDISLTDLPANEWGRNYGIINVPATAVSMTPVLVHDSFSSSHSVWYTDIQMIKITGAFGFSDHPITDTDAYQAINSGSFVFKDFESPSAPTESGESANRIYLYAPYTDEDPITGAKKLTAYRNTYDFVQGVWENGGKRVEASMVSSDATDSTLALQTAQKYFKDKGKALKSYEFEHISGPLNVGDVVPYIWKELGIAEALVVRRQSGYLIGQQVYYKVQLGGDLAFQRSTMYLLEQRLQEITGDAAYFTPPPSPYPGTATAGGIVTPAVPSVNPGLNQVIVSWQYPQKILSSSAFGGFLLLRGSTTSVGGATTAATGDGTTATITTTSAHGLVAGDEIVIAGMVPSTYNGGYTVTAAPTTTQISFKNTTTDAQTVAGAVNKVTAWYKASTGEVPASAVNPVAPDTAVPIYTDSDLPGGNAVAYKSAAIDVSGPNPVITGYSQISSLATPTEIKDSLTNSYTGLGIDVPKIVKSVTYNGSATALKVSTITSGSSTTATVTTTTAHGLSTGYVVGITGASGTNAGDVNGGFYVITYVDTTSFTIVKTGTNSLSLTGGTVNAWNISGAFVDNDNNTRALGDTWSLVQFPTGQLAYSEADGKLYRNGKPGTTAFANKWTRAAVDAIDVTSDGSIVISADRLTSGSINAGVINVSNLNASEIKSGSLTLTPLSTNAITSTNFTVTNTGDVTANSITLGAVTSDTVGNDTSSSGRISIVPSTSQSAATFRIQADAAGTLYKEVGIYSATSGSSSADSTVTTDSAHGFIAGQFVSFQNTGNSAWNAITASLPVQIKTVPSTTTFTIRPSSALTALSAGNAGTVRSYKRLNIVSPGGTFIYQDGTSPGVMGVGSVAIGTSFNNIGIGGLATPADGEVVFLTNTTPRYGGGANLYSSNGTSSLNTSGSFSATGSIESGINGTTRGAFLARGDGTNGGYIALYSGVGSGGGTLSYDVANSRLNFNTNTYVSGNLTTSGTVNSSNLPTQIVSAVSSTSTASVAAGGFLTASVTWSMTSSPSTVVATMYHSSTTNAAWTATVWSYSTSGATIYYYNTGNSASTSSRQAMVMATFG